MRCFAQYGVTFKTVEEKETKGGRACGRVDRCHQMSITHTAGASSRKFKLELCTSIALFDCKIEAKERVGYIVAHSSGGQIELAEALKSALRLKIFDGLEAIRQLANTKLGSESVFDVSIKEVNNDEVIYHFATEEDSVDALIDTEMQKFQQGVLFRAISKQIKELRSELESLDNLDLTHICKTKIGLLLDKYLIVLVYCKVCPATKQHTLFETTIQLSKDIFENFWDYCNTSSQD